MNNKKLLCVVLVMLPFVVISFSFKEGKTNFILDEPNSINSNENSSDIGVIDDADTSINDEYNIKILVGEEVIEMPLEEYIIGVVAGEMPASFHEEALKAQAIASRTYALYKKNNNHNTYDLTNSTSNQVYISLEDMKNKWGSGFDKYYSKIKSAVEDTKGKILTYDDEIIEAFYFAMSSGITEDASTVFNETREYLKSVESTPDNKELKNYEVLKEIERSEFASKLGLQCDNLTIDYTNTTESGYIENISICGKVFKGSNFRSLLNLRSANFKIDIDDKISITTFGYGHGVGLSQYGANGYAISGKTYEEILKHYYTGVEIEDIKNV